MKDKFDPGACIYAAKEITRHIDAMRQEISGVRSGTDIEYIHRMRVATRRMRMALTLFRRCLPEKKLNGWMTEVKRITRALGAARDTDVQIDAMKLVLDRVPLPNQRPGIRRLVLRLQQQRARLQADVNTALDKLEKKGVLDEMQAALAPQLALQAEVYSYSPVLYQLGANAIEDRLEDLLAYEDIVNQPEQVERLHAMRITAKQLRYTLESFAPLYPDELKRYIQVMRKVQDALGEIHDCDVWSVYLPQFLQQERELALAYFGTARPANRLVPGLQFFMDDRRQEREKIYLAFVKDWDKWKRQAVWENLRRVVELPFQAQEEQSLSAGPLVEVIEDRDEE